MNDALLLLAVALLSTSQVLQKVGAVRRLGGRRRPVEWFRALVSPEFLAAGVTIVAGTTLWLIVLYRMDLSRAFPFLSLGAIVVVGASRVFLREPVSRVRWVGVALIAAGVALVAQT
jgi:drug/metabolite transporter (DMT)-like permease